MAKRKIVSELEFGDYQTPSELAVASLSVLRFWEFEPRSAFEPTCGRGSFIRASLSMFGQLEKVLGLEVNAEYVHGLRIDLQASGDSERVEVVHGDIFDFDFASALSHLADPLLIFGNPPWVTNAQIAATNGSNLPNKSNFKHDRGIDALTGHGNFDISEWIILEAVKTMAQRDGVVAMLCKTSVARKVLARIWKTDYEIARTAIYQIDAQRNFGAAVDACLFVAKTGGSDRTRSCDVYSTPNDTVATKKIGMRGQTLVSDIGAFSSTRHVWSDETKSQWRSGIKHDCAALMELIETDDGYVNGLGDAVDLEPEYVYRLYKGE